MTIQPTRLLIRLTPGTLRPRIGVCAINELRGGPETLLRWLETQLGLPTVENHRANCVTEYASALDAVNDAVIRGSMSADRWATASELLARRDELHLSGWNSEQSDGLPEIVQSLARVAGYREFVFPNLSERLQRVVEALNDGQVLPEHVCVLTDDVGRWPKRWQAVLSRLNVEQFSDSPRGAAPATALRHAQSVVRGGKASNVELDRSLRYVHTLSQTAAVEFVAATLAHNRAQLGRTVIVCEDDQLAMRLDARLERHGVPTMGASTCSPAHPVLQVLPLSLALCWQPVNAQCLLDFLTLPICPIPRRAATTLAAALAVQPGLGSAEWQRCLEELCSAESDPDGKLQARLDQWLFSERTTRNSSIATRLVRERCATVAQWASGLAVAMEAEEVPRLFLINALHVAAGQATLLGELAQSQGENLSEPQLSRLIEEALSSGVEAVGAIEAEGGPIRVRSLSEIADPCYRVIWLGLGTSDAKACRWSADQLNTLRSHEIEIDDGANSLSSLRTAEARGLCFVEDALLAILLPQDIEKRLHPLWLAVRSMLCANVVDNAQSLESMIEDETVSSLTPFAFGIQSIAVEPPQRLRASWSVDPALLSDRNTVSATELEDRLACPLKWVLRHMANLRPSSIAQIPQDYQLKGSFCHKILEYAFKGGGELPAVEEAVARVEALFDERVELDAEPLAQSDRYRDRQSLRKELSYATRVLINTLASGGYRIKDIEATVQGHAFGKPLVGSIDCLVERVDGDEAIIDFKYGGKKYERMIADGKAVQLATYAYSRSTETGRFPAVAYLVISDGLLFTPSGGPISGGVDRSIVNGPGIGAVWEHFQAAITNAASWLISDGQIPARPLQHPDEWPDGVGMVLATDSVASEVQPVCKYCDYQHLCGLRQLK